MSLLAIVAACQGPDSPFVVDPAEAIDAVHVQIDPVSSRRDLVAVAAPPEAHLTWRMNGQDAQWKGPVVPARLVEPGQEWTVHAALADHAAGEASIVVPEPPGGNVLILLIDDVGVDHVGVYGNPEAPPTPVMDALAAEGMRFDRAYASPVCSPTRGILITGRHARRTGLGWIADTGDRNYALPLEAVTIAEALDDAWGGPWPTSAVGKWHMAGPAHPDVLTHPNDQGFDWFGGSVGNPLYAEGFGYWVWERNLNGVVEESTTYMTTASVDDALARMDAMPEPWFLYVAFHAAHTPLSAPPLELHTQDVDDDSSSEDLFDAVLEALDTEIGRLLDGMGDRRRDTTILLMGDNGTPEHAVDPPLDPKRAKHSVYEAGIKVPLIVAGPHVAVPGSTSDALIHVADLFATTAEIAGVPLGGPDDALTLDLTHEIDLDSRSLLPHLADPDAPGRAMIYVEGFSPNGPQVDKGIDKRTVMDERFKLVRLKDRDEFYDLADPDHIDDGPDLLGTSLDDEASLALDRLTEEMDWLRETVLYDGF